MCARQVDDHSPIEIGRSCVGFGEPTWMVAEVSGNHGGSLERAKTMLRAAAEAGADAVKIQVYRPDTITLPSDKPDFRIDRQNAWASYRTMYELYESAHTPYEWLPELFECASVHGIDLFGSVFDDSAVDALEQFDVAAYKVAAPEVCDLPLLRKIASTGKPVLLSTGVATLEDIARAIDTLRSHGAGGIVLLKCSTAYPAPEDEVNLRTIPNMAETFGCPAGFSDHTIGTSIPIAAVSLGADAIEKHIKLADEDETVDSFFSLTIEEFGSMVKEVRRVERALGKVEYRLTPSVQDNAKGRRSLYVSAPIDKGGAFSRENIKSVRPGHGLATAYYDIVLGRRAATDLEVGDRLSWEVIE